MKQFALTVAAMAVTMALAGQGWAADPASKRVQTETQTQAQTQSQVQSQVQVRDQERIYGSQLMTEQERIEHRNQMRVLKTEEERAAFQKAHHEKMKERAKAKGLALPDDPPAQGKGMGAGKSKGSGYGTGGGYGQGRR